MESRHKATKGAEAADGNSVRGTRYEDQFFKTKLCMFWEKGACTRGSNCKYAHGDKELNEMPNLTKTSLCKDLLTTGTCTRSDCLFAHSVEELRATNKFYKTSMCSFHRVGQCKLGAACRHAHDPSELTEVARVKALTLDDAEVGGMGPCGRTAARRGPRKSRAEKSAKKILVSTAEEEDDEFPETPTWERMTTSPPTLGWLPTAAFQPVSPEGFNAPSVSSNSTATGGAATASQHSDDQDDELDDVGDMWARMKTVPAPAVAAGTPMVAMSRGAMMMGQSMIRNEIQAVPVTAAGQLQMPADMWSRQTSGGVMIQQVDQMAVPFNRGVSGDVQQMVMVQAMPQAMPSMPAVQAMPAGQATVQAVQGMQPLQGMQAVQGVQPMQGMQAVQGVQPMQGMQAVQVPCLLVPVPMQAQQVPQQMPQQPEKGGYMDMNSGVAVPCGIDLKMAPEMEARLLESAMPEVYED